MWSLIKEVYTRHRRILDKKRLGDSWNSRMEVRIRTRSLWTQWTKWTWEAIYSIRERTAQSSLRKTFKGPIKASWGKDSLQLRSTIALNEFLRCKWKTSLKNKATWIRKS